MGRHFQTFKLNLTYTVIQGDAHGHAGVGRILGDVAGDPLGAQLPLVADLGDVAHVQLLSPAGGQGHALVLVDQLVLEEPADQVAAAVHLQLPRRLGLQRPRGHRRGRSCPPIAGR
jgi:hypothetical protein